jgi:hypothetical protein
MDDFGNLISNTIASHASVLAFAAFMLCAECSLSQILGDTTLQLYGVIL